MGYGCEESAMVTKRQIELQRGDVVRLNRGDGTQAKRIVSAPPAKLREGKTAREVWAVWLEGVDGPVPLEWCRPEQAKTVRQRPSKVTS
jgi:hypothetical protein